jgi:hypothetical protein
MEQSLALAKAYVVLAQRRIYFYKAGTRKMPTPHAINGRVATREDFESGNAIFYLSDNRAVSYSFGRPLPVWAVITTSGSAHNLPAQGTRVQIIQAERDKEDVLLGYVYHGETGICSLRDVSIENSTHTWNYLQTGAFTVFLLLACTAILYIRFGERQQVRLRNRPHA